MSHMSRQVARSYRPYDHNQSQSNEFFLDSRNALNPLSSIYLKVGGNFHFSKISRLAKRVAKAIALLAELSM